jgi:hypoxanthine phosphoribosyltransferase
VVRAVKFEAPSWSQIYKLLLRLSSKIRSASYTPDAIVGISRGGWFPARLLSDLLETTNLVNVKTECYTGIAKSVKQPRLIQFISGEVSGKKVLVVDEIADSGRTLKLVVNYLKEQGAAEVKTAVLYRKPKSVITPDFCEKKTDSWVVFPWELKETMRSIHKTGCIDPSRAEADFVALRKAGVSKRLIARFRQEFSEMGHC